MVGKGLLKICDFQHTLRSSCTTLNEDATKIHVFSELLLSSLTSSNTYKDEQELLPNSISHDKCKFQKDSMKKKKCKNRDGPLNDVSVNTASLLVGA